MFQLFDFLIHYYPNFLLLIVLRKTFSSKGQYSGFLFVIFLFLLSVVDYSKLYTFNAFSTQSIYVFLQLVLIVIYLCVAWLYSELSLSGWSLYHISVILMWWFFYESERTLLLAVIFDYTPLSITELLVINDLFMTLFSIFLIQLHFNFSIHISPIIILILGMLSFFVEFFVYQKLNVSSLEQCYVIGYITLAMIFTYWCISTIIRQMETLWEQSKQELLQETELQNARILYKNIRIQRHEIRNQFTLLSVLLQQKKYEELQAYFDEYRTETNTLLSSVSSGNDIIDAVLNQELWKIKEKQIPVEMKAALPSSLQVQMSDMGAILFNSIDNALEASLSVKEPFIYVELSKQKNYIVILVKNKVDINIFKDNPFLHTTKNDMSSHGNGISILKRITEKYDGDIHFSQKDDFFQLSIMIKDICITSKEKQLLI